MFVLLFANVRVNTDEQNEKYGDIMCEYPLSLSQPVPSSGVPVWVMGGVFSLHHKVGKDSMPHKVGKE